MAALEVQNIHKSFGKVKVLDGISFSIEQGEVLAILGSSGSGKTTLLRSLNFLETPDAGKIILNGSVLFDGDTEKNVSDAETRRRRLHFGLVFQSFNLFPQYTVLKNVMLAPQLLADEEIKKAYKSAAKRKEEPSLPRKQSQIFSTLARSRPSLKLGTHSRI